MEKRADIFSILKQEGKLETLLLSSAKETIDDPYEKNRVFTMMNPLPVKAYVTQISFEALKWKYVGQLPTGSIQVMAEKKDKTLFLAADKIQYKGNDYKCYRDDSQGFLILERESYIIIILALKND
jgi:hypothetical protein